MEKRQVFPASRGSVRGIDADKCTFCGVCAKKCPSDAIMVQRSEKSWEINPFSCVVCGVCAEVCPKKCIVLDEAYSPAAFVKNTRKFVQEDKEASQAG